MASQVLSGTGNVSYTNNTGQNVRLVINYLSCADTIGMSWGGVSISSDNSLPVTFGRNLAYAYSSGTTTTVDSNNAKSGYRGLALPTEIMLSAGQTFSVSSLNPGTSIGAYNIVVIPEAG